MLFYLYEQFGADFLLANLFKYLTFRTGGALMTSLIISFIIGPWFIKWLKSRQKDGQPIREDGPQTHLISKRGTPTMGGLMIMSVVIASTLIWANLHNSFVWACLSVCFAFGLLGAMDDYTKLSKKNTKGVSAGQKLLVQFVIAGILSWWISTHHGSDLRYVLTFPFLKEFTVDLGVSFFLFASLVIVGASNAVNLTDGLDGLATVPVMISAACFGLVSYLVGNAVFANYLQVHPVPGSGELAILAGAVIGAGLGFLWFNAPPAQVFMGDTGSLALGGLLGTMAVITKHELVLFIIGGVFVIEAFSVMIQVGYYKLTGKRIFLMAPIHHHFEQLGWAEPTIVIRFWIISIIFGLIGLSTLKLR